MKLRPLCAVVTAAGTGSRMQSSQPEPLHPLCGRPMLLHVLDTLSELYVERVVVVVAQAAEPMLRALQPEMPSDLAVELVAQRMTRGTADAVSVALTALPDDLEEADIVVLPGDAPLLRPATLSDLVVEHRESGAAATLLTSRVDDPRGFGRVVRAPDGRLARVVEDADATEAELAIDEVATSVSCFRRGLLAPALRRVTPDNAKGEYHLADVVGVLHGTGHKVVALSTSDPASAVGVSDLAQLAAAESELRRRIAERWMRSGVTITDPDHTYVDVSVRLARDVTLLAGTMLAGRTVVGERARIGPYAQLTDCVVGEGAAVEQSVCVEADIGADSHVGPFAHVAAGGRVPPGATTGPFYNDLGGDHHGS